ncbi:MAG: hypothetical protein C0481_02530 [Phenylobacterium sp.]|uniref:hypothetical protein n=1 Tax=Phenylobacterium sp. TaxID=1871053 RepID=UPI0025EF3CB5|nr:hypothetical protein [Phenylobacterium sp.]MBA4010720.1 hypothetical protein [Phenylobacterium sp.]
MNSLPLVAAALCSIISASFWLWAALTPIPALNIGGYDNDGAGAAAMYRALQKQARLNAVAALFACAAALMAALALPLAS